MRQATDARTALDAAMREANDLLRKANGLGGELKSAGLPSLGVR
jgi:hypothetical protein